MSYEAVYLYNNRNEFLGVAIKKTDAPKLHSVNVWGDSPEDVADFKKTLASLNDEQDLRQFWPAANDAEVADLVADEAWEPLELHEEQVPDWENSTLVYRRDSVYGYDYDGQTDTLTPRPNPSTGQPEWRETDELDGERSNILMKKALVPDPMEAQARFFKAQEVVARRRLAATV